MNILISIIIPVYNTDKYLSECIDSVLNQNYHKFELILIDDGSTDNSGIICDEYARKDERIISLHQNNAGVSAARNKGLETARGEYIVFIDSDDKVAPTYLSDFFPFLADLCIQGLSLVDSRTGKSSHLGFDSSLIATTDREIGSIFAEAEIHSTTKGPCNKLYKTDIIRRYGIRFDPRYSYGEDHLFVLEYMTHCHSISRIERANYFYINRNTISLTNKPLPYKELSAYAREAHTRRQELILRFGIDNSDYNRYILEEQAHLIYQSIYALYSTEGNFPAETRWNFICEIYTEDYEMMIQSTRLPLIFRLMKIALKLKCRWITDPSLLILSRGKEWIKKHC